MKKNFPPVLLVTMVTVVISVTAGLLAPDTSVQPEQCRSLVVRTASALVKSPLYLGLYRLCLLRLRGGEPPLRTLFEFYRDPRLFLGAFAANYSVSLVIYVINDIIGSAEHHGLAAVTTALKLVVIVISVLFFAVDFAYALEPEKGVVKAFGRSVKSALGVKRLLVIFGAALLVSAVTNLYGSLMLSVYGTLYIVLEYLQFVPDTVCLLMTIYAGNWLLRTDEEPPDDF